MNDSLYDFLVYGLPRLLMMLILVITTLAVLNVFAAPMTYSYSQSTGVINNIYSYQQTHFLSGSTNVYVLQIDPTSGHLFNTTVNCNFYHVNQTVTLTTMTTERQAFYLLWFWGYIAASSSNSTTLESMPQGC